MNNDLRRKLDRITDVLWSGGVVNPVTYIEQLSYLIFLKLLDEEEANRERRARMGGSASSHSLFPNGGAKYRWSKWRFQSGAALRDFIRDGVFPYMASKMAEDPGVAEYFRDAVLEITDPNVLKQVIDELDTIDFAKLGPDVKGDIFEYLLTHLGTSSLNGQFRTPRQVRALMVQLADPDVGDTILDPACGTGGFLSDAVDHILARYSSQPIEIPIYGEEWLAEQGLTLQEAKARYPQLQTYFRGAGERLPSWKKLEGAVFGFDVSRQMVRIATMNLVLHGIRRAGVKRANALSDAGGLSEDDLNRRYKVILANPPFSGKLPNESIRSDLPTSAKKSELLFLALMMEALAVGGRCAVVLPEGVLTGDSQAHVDLRRRLVEDFELQAVIGLPSGVFRPYAGVKTAILVFKRLAKAVPAGQARVWFYEVEHDGYAKRLSAGGRTEDAARNDIPDVFAQWSARSSKGYRPVAGKHGWTSAVDIAARAYDLAPRLHLAARTAAHSHPCHTIGDLCSLTKGTASAQNAVPGPYPLVTTAEEPKTAKEFSFDGEAICVPLVSSTGHGHASIKRLTYMKGKFAAASIIAVLQVTRPDLVLPRYLYYYLESHKDQVLVPLMKGAANVSLSLQKIASVAVPLPPLETQQQLVAELERVDDEVEATRARIRELQVQRNSEMGKLREVLAGV